MLLQRIPLRLVGLLAGRAEKAGQSEKAKSGLQRTLQRATAGHYDG